MDLQTEVPSEVGPVSGVEETPAVLVPPEGPAALQAPMRASKPKSPEVTVAQLEIGPEPERVKDSRVISVISGLLMSFF